MARKSLDPFRVIIGVLMTRCDSALLLGVVNAARLRVDLTMSGSEAMSQRTLMRALIPGLYAGYDQLADEARLAVANVAFRNSGPAYRNTTDHAVEALGLAGWQVRGQELASMRQSCETVQFGSADSARLVTRITLAGSLNHE